MCRRGPRDQSHRLVPGSRGKMHRRIKADGRNSSHSNLENSSFCFDRAEAGEEGSWLCWRRDGVDNVLQRAFRLLKRQACPHASLCLELPLLMLSARRDRRARPEDPPVDSPDRSCRARTVSWLDRIPRSDPRRKRDWLRHERRSREDGDEGSRRSGVRSHAVAT